jgi:hypothetical protein
MRVQLACPSRHGIFRPSVQLQAQLVPEGGGGVIKCIVGEWKAILGNVNIAFATAVDVTGMHDMREPAAVETGPGRISGHVITKRKQEDLSRTVQSCSVRLWLTH